MSKFLTFVVWLAFASSLGYLSFLGAVECSLPPFIAGGLAASLTAASGAFAARFRTTRGLVEFAGMLLTLALLTGFDFCNLVQQVQRHSAATVATAEAGAAVEASEVDRLRQERDKAEREWTEARNLASAELATGKVSGKAGKGGTYDSLIAVAANLEEVLQRKETALREAMTAAKTATVAVAQVDHGRHLLAVLPWWTLLLAAGMLEASCAALAWSLGNGRTRKLSTVSDTRLPDQLPASAPAEKLEPAAEEPAPSNVVEMPTATIPVSAGELRVLSRLSQRAYRAPVNGSKPKAKAS